MSPTISSSGAQHVDMHRKVLLRRALIRMLPRTSFPGAAYVPFCGDGDLAIELYSECDLWAADLDPARTATFQQRFPTAHVVTGDCDAFPFAPDGSYAGHKAGSRHLAPVSTPTPPKRGSGASRGSQGRSRASAQVGLPAFAVADLDAYAYPYDSFRSFMAHATLTDRAVIFFTDGQLQAIKRVGSWRYPNGDRDRTDDVTTKRKLFNAYWSKVVRPWWWTTCKSYGLRPMIERFYTRQGNMLYWGALVGRS